MTRHKWFKFDAETWLSDPKLRLVSYRAKGIWIHLICLCHLSERYGYLVINKQKMCKETVRQLLNLSRTDTIHLQQLIDNGILRQDKDGFFYCHKLLKDKDLEERQREFGKKGGNPSLNPTLNPSLKPEREKESESEKTKNNNLIDIKNNNSNSVRDSLVTPTLELINNFISENNLKINPDRFFNYYEARGWKIKGEAIENWQSLALSWQESEKKGGLGDKNWLDNTKPLTRAEKSAIALDSQKETINKADYQFFK